MKTLIACLLLAAGSINAANTFDSLRWTATATDGARLPLGSPLTLTWSIVSDGLALPPIRTPASNPNPQSNLIVRLENLWNVPAGDRISDLTQRPWFAAIQSRLDIYASKTGLTYLYVTDDGANFGAGGKTSSPTRGDVRIAGTDPDLASMRPTAAISAGRVIGIAARAGRTYQLERATVSLSSWTPIGAPTVIADDQNLELTDPNPPTERAFYRYDITLTP